MREIHRRRQPIGAFVVYSYPDDELRQNVPGYVSFGDWYEDDSADEYGVPDDEILYFMPDGEAELLNYQDQPTSEFVIHSFRLRYG